MPQNRIPGGAKNLYQSQRDIYDITHGGIPNPRPSKPAASTESRVTGREAISPAARKQIAGQKARMKFRQKATVPAPPAETGQQPDARMKFGRKPKLSNQY